MRNLLLPICFLVFIEWGWAQENSEVLYANEHFNTLVLFPAPIKQAVTGSGDFLFSYSSEQPQSLGLLKAQPGPDSNLVVVTADGAIFSFVLKYKDSLPALHYFISPGDQLKQKPLSAEGHEKVGGKPTGSVKPNPARFTPFCKFYLSHTKGILKRQRKQGLVLKVREVIHREGEVYLIAEIENHSAIDLEIAGLDLFMLRGNSRKNTSFQKVLLKPAFQFHLPGKIRKGQESSFVLVYPKFTTSTHDKLRFELQEANGNRSLQCTFRY